MTDKKDKIVNKTRPPIVVILGHVDHGKTSLLDYIRKTKVTEGEAGGITQHIGAYQIEDNGKIITFLDTPGHEAFSAIRSRGANVADIAILVIASDEGIKPQTKESIKILKESQTPFIVAISKIDKDGANGQRIRQELAELEVLVEDYGGQTPVAEISSKTGAGVEHLLELINLLSDLEEIKSDPNKNAVGAVIESHIEKQRGVIATLLILDGKLKTGDWISAGNALAKIKAMEDFTGKRIDEALPSQPCVVMGWESVPALGQEFHSFDNKKDAEKLTKETEKNITKLFEGTNVAPFNANIIIKADVQSSLEAIDQTLRTIISEKASYKVVDFGVGNINDNDVKNARAKNASIIGFHVETDKSAKQMAERENIYIETADIIYRLVEMVRTRMAELLPVEIVRKPLGKLKILALFGTSGKSQIVGGKVTEGKAVRGSVVDVLRNNSVLMSGKLVQLQQKKEDVTEVTQGNECGMRIDPSAKTISGITIKESDQLAFFEEEKIKGEL